MNSESLSPMGWGLAIGLPLALMALPVSLPARPAVGRPSGFSVLLGLVMAIPIVACIALTWRQEFPFLGDHNVHLRFDLEGLGFWRIWFLPIAVVVALAVAYEKRHPRKRWLALLTLPALAMGLAVSSPARFAVRFPGLFRFFSFPANFLAHAFSWESPFNAARLTNAAAPLVWLLLLRPLIVGRWPDRTIAPLAAFLFFQKDFIYYFTSSYLEPWALVLILTAMELLFVEGHDGALLSALLIGVAAMTKEQAILLLPFFGLMAFTKQDRGRDMVRKAVLMLGAATPFLLYYDVRSHSEVWRKVVLESVSDAFTVQRFIQFGQRLHQQFGIASMAMVVLATVCLILSVVPNRRRLFFALMTAAALTQISFFFLDHESFHWVGYPRFQLISIVLLSAPLLLIGPWLNERESQQGKRTSGGVIMLSLTLILIGLHLPSTWSFMSKARGADVERNFFEHRDAPVYFPVAALNDAALQRGMLDGVKQIRLLSNIHGIVPGYGLFSLPVAYPRIFSSWQVEVDGLDFRTLGKCRCTTPSQVIEGFFVYFPTGTGSGYPRAPMQRAAALCAEEMTRTCSTTLSMRRAGQLIGAIGSGVRTTVKSAPANGSARQHRPES